MKKLRASHWQRRSQSAATSLRIDFDDHHCILPFVKHKPRKTHAKALHQLIPKLTTSTRFTSNHQLAGYAFDYRDEMGAIDFQSFVQTFETFPWGEQMQQREKMAGGCSATISVVDQEQDFVFWLSVMGDNLRPTFLLGAVYKKKLRKSSRVEASRTVDWCETRIAPSRRSVISAFRIFFTGDTHKLMKQFRAYKLYDRHESMTPILKS